MAMAMATCIKMLRCCGICWSRVFCIYQHWTIYELFMNYLWTIYELFMNYLWTIYELSMNYLWTIYELFMNYLWTVWNLMIFEYLTTWILETKNLNTLRFEWLNVWILEYLSTWIGKNIGFQSFFGRLQVILGMHPNLTLHEELSIVATVGVHSTPKWSQTTKTSNWKS